MGSDSIKGAVKVFREALEALSGGCSEGGMSAGVAGGVHVGAHDANRAVITPDLQGAVLDDNQTMLKPRQALPVH